MVVLNQPIDLNHIVRLNPVMKKEDMVKKGAVPPPPPPRDPSKPIVPVVVEAYDVSLPHP